MNTKNLLAIVAILLYAASFAQTKEQVAEMYMKMTTNVNGSAEKDYRAYSLPIDKEKGEGNVSDFSTLNINEFNGSAIYKDMMPTIPADHSKISEIAIYMSIYNTLGIYEPVKDKALQTSMIKLKDAMVKLLKNSSYKVTALKTEKDEYSEDNSLKAEVQYEVSFPAIDYNGLPKTSKQGNNKKQADYFNLLADRIEKSLDSKNKTIIKEKFSMNEIKIGGKSYWLPYQAFQVIDPIVYSIIQFKI